MWHPSCKPGDKPWMGRRQGSAYDKWNISLVICDVLVGQSLVYLEGFPWLFIVLYYVSFRHRIARLSGNPILTSSNFFAGKWNKQFTNQRLYCLRGCSCPSARMSVCLSDSPSPFHIVHMFVSKMKQSRHKSMFLLLYKFSQKSGSGSRKETH